jgi:hypothetical protein
VSDANIILREIRHWRDYVHVLSVGRQDRAWNEPVFGDLLLGRSTFAVEGHGRFVRGGARFGGPSNNRARVILRERFRS